MITRIQDSDIGSLRRKAGQRLSELLRAQGQPGLFLTSGGSSLVLLDHIDMDVLGPHLTLGVLDDRWSTDEKVNNFMQFSRSKFAQAAHERGCEFIDTVPQTGESLEQTAERFETDLRAWKDRNPAGRVVVTQGVGPDGHTAGILPFPENPELFEKLFNDPKYWVAGYDAGTKNPHPLRITVTFLFMREVIDHALIYVESADKAPAFEKALSPGSLAEIPARILQEMKAAEIYSSFGLHS